jgi:phage tail sheath protein FI
MPTYLHPGVYVEEIPSGVKPIEGVSTSITAFVGPARKGPNGEAVLIHSFDDYERTYGPIYSASDQMGLAVSAFYLNGGRDAYIARLVSNSASISKASISVTGEDTDGQYVLKFTATSVGDWGNEVYIRINKPNPTDLIFTLEVGHLENGELFADETYSGVDMNSKSDNYVLTQVNGNSQLVELSLEPATVNAYQQGTLTGGAMADTVDLFSNASTGIQDDMTMSLNLDDLGVKRITLGLASALGLSGDNTDDGEAVAGEVQNAVRALSKGSDTYASFTCAYDANRQFVLTSGETSSFSSVVVYDGDESNKDLANFLKLDTAGSPSSVHGSAKVIPVALPGVTGQGEALTGGEEGPPTSSDYKDFFGNKLKKIRDVSIIVLPNQYMPMQGGNLAISEALAHAEETRSRMVIVDPPPSPALVQASQVESMSLPISTYAVLYYPYVKVVNPFYNADTNPNAPKTLTIAPSAFAAGMWAKIDGKRGVWKAPAGVETALLGVSGLEYDVGDGEQDQLNPLGINCLRKMPSFGPVMWGTRTLATKADPEWRYVPIRRTAIMIEQSIYNGIQWAVFEPNNFNLWASLRVNIGSFMDGLFRAGAFQGQKASDAYFVRCGLGDTMTQGDIDRGQVIVIVGFAPLKPAEFVIVRIQQKVAQQ